MKKPFFICVLELEDGCWYVGRGTGGASKRIKQHVCGKGSSWTQLHPVVAVHSIHEGDENEERLTTLDMMKIYGFEKVRGAGYSLAVYPPNYPTPALDSHVLRALVSQSVSQQNLTQIIG